MSSGQASVPGPLPCCATSFSSKCWEACFTHVRLSFTPPLSPPKYLRVFTNKNNIKRRGEKKKKNETEWQKRNEINV